MCREHPEISFFPSRGEAGDEGKASVVPAASYGPSASPFTAEVNNHSHRIDTVATAPVRNTFERLSITSDQNEINTSGREIVGHRFSDTRRRASHQRTTLVTDRSNATRANPTPPS